MKKGGEEDGLRDKGEKKKVASPLRWKVQNIQINEKEPE